LARLRRDGLGTDESRGVIFSWEQTGGARKKSPPVQVARGGLKGLREIRVSVSQESCHQHGFGVTEHLSLPVLFAGEGVDDFEVLHVVVEIGAEG
jgi:hypothetical protein